MKPGFTYIELIITILLVSILSGFIMIGVTHAKQSLYRIKIKERAYESLKDYTEIWKGKVFANDIGSIVEDCEQEKKYCLQEDGCESDNAIYGKPCYSINIPILDSQIAKIARITTQMRWEWKGQEDTLFFYVSQIILP